MLAPLSYNVGVVGNDACFCNCAWSHICETDFLAPVYVDTTPGCLLWSTWGASLGEDKPWARAILHTKVARQANFPPKKHSTPIGGMSWAWDTFPYCIPPEFWTPCTVTLCCYAGPSASIALQNNWYGDMVVRVAVEQAAINSATPIIWVCGLTVYLIPTTRKPDGVYTDGVQGWQPLGVRHGSHTQKWPCGSVQGARDPQFLYSVGIEMNEAPDHYAKLGTSLPPSPVTPQCPCNVIRSGEPQLPPHKVWTRRCPRPHT